jgi:hypothetical protein
MRGLKCRVERVRPTRKGKTECESIQKRTNIWNIHGAKQLPPIPATREKEGYTEEK